METKEAIINNYNHSITITERKNLLITGVKKIENFDSEEFLLETETAFVGSVKLLEKIVIERFLLALLYREVGFRVKGSTCLVIFKEELAFFSLSENPVIGGL